MDVFTKSIRTLLIMADNSGYSRAAMIEAVCTLAGLSEQAIVELFEEEPILP